MVFAKSLVFLFFSNISIAFSGFFSITLVTIFITLLLSSSLSCPALTILSITIDSLFSTISIIFSNLSLLSISLILLVIKFPTESSLSLYLI